MPGECVEIATGAPMPAGADAVVLGSLRGLVVDAAVRAVRELVVEAALGVNKQTLFATYDFAGFPVIETRARFLIPTRYCDDVVIETAFAEALNRGTGAIPEPNFRLDPGQCITLTSCVARRACSCSSAHTQCATQRRGEARCRLARYSRLFNPPESCQL